MTFTLIKTYPNSHQRILTVQSLQWQDNPESVIALTAETGAIALTPEDTPDLWAQLPPRQGETA
jgi:hypothetical protein